MKKMMITLFVVFGAFSCALAQDQIPNPLIDVEAHLQATGEAMELRAKRRVSVEQFITMSKEEGTIVLDTRSVEKFAMLHIKGAKHLNFSEFTAATLEALIPGKGTRILIYCNNNFFGAPVAFPSKCAAGALNIPTFIALYEYGYKNVYELGPAVKVKDTALDFAGSRVDD